MVDTGCEGSHQIEEWEWVLLGLVSSWDSRGSCHTDRPSGVHLKRVGLHPNPHLWSWTLCSDWKNEICVGRLSPRDIAKGASRSGLGIWLGGLVDILSISCQEEVTARTHWKDAFTFVSSWMSRRRWLGRGRSGLLCLDFASVNHTV